MFDDVFFFSLVFIFQWHLAIFIELNIDLKNYRKLKKLVVNKFNVSASCVQQGLVTFMFDSLNARKFSRTVREEGGIDNDYTKSTKSLIKYIK